MNISKIYRLSVLFILMIAFAFIAQLYINFKNYITSTQQNLKIAVFLKDTQTSKDEILDIINQKYFANNIEYIDKDDAFEKMLEISPELKDVAINKEIRYPSYIILKDFVNLNKSSLENNVNELFALEFVDDVCYDKQAFSKLFDNVRLFKIYKYIFIALFCVSIIIYVLKFILFCIKQEYKQICINILEALVVAICSYIFICFCMVIKNNSIFALDWKILYVLLPVSMIINFSNIRLNVNVKN